MSASEGSARHRSREVALQVLFAFDLRDLRGAGGEPARVQEVFDEVAANFEMPGGVRSFALELCTGTLRDAEEVDAAIAEEARNWRIDRMAVVDRNIMRLATWELLRTETPAAVVLDEAVEMSRRFGADRSPAFVNGILDAVARAARGATEG